MRNFASRCPGLGTKRVSALKISIPYYDNDGNPFERDKIELVEKLFSSVFGGWQVNEGRGEWLNKNGKVYPAKKEGHYTIELSEKPIPSKIEIIEKLLRSYLQQKEIYLRLVELEK